MECINVVYSIIVNVLRYQKTKTKQNTTQNRLLIGLVVKLELIPQIFSRPRRHASNHDVWSPTIYN